MIKNPVTAAADCAIQWKGRFTETHDTVSRPLSAPHLALCAFWFFPEVTITRRGEHFESIQHTEAGATGQLKTLLKEGSRTALESAKNDEVTVSQECFISKEINCNASFIVISFLKNAPCFAVTPCIPRSCSHVKLYMEFCKASDLKFYI